MTSSQHLKVIGSRPIYRFFLPIDGRPFSSSEFTNIDAGAGERAFAEASHDGLTIVINPDEYAPAGLELLAGRVVLWFLSRLAIDRPETYQQAPRLLASSAGYAEMRVRALEKVNPDRSKPIVVSDVASYEFCRGRGFDVYLSPPPVSEAVYGARNPNTDCGFRWWTDIDSYAGPFVGALNSIPGVPLANTGFDLENLREIHHSIVVQNPAIWTFAYDAALSTALGSPLISTELSPIWGFEPGIDFFQVSTPDELHFVVRSVMRWPLSTHLLATRGGKKAGVFRSDRVFRSLIMEGVF